ncbi:glycosyltransferase family 2 protein [Zhihengliuella sp. ISTPL4]|uniref:glycosyltransferase family 2 protein n=1 Tax=Zhihengliuella sp. ISTPL4 TaxID=2058657 RepID=UPI000C7C95DA|nr:glycosyltransferase family 2 protein [Zhihengliuella sp. ISTPL4]
MMAATAENGGHARPLSVIVPTHNVRSWISETIRSILAQDVVDMEVIVVDDHSDDGTPELIERVAAADSRVTVVRATNRGGGSARNEGVARATGRYIVFADGDDIVPEGAYRALVESLEASGSQIAVGDYLKFSPTATWRPTASMRAFDTPVRGATLSDIPTLIFSRPCWNKAFDRAFWVENDIRFPDVPRSNDIVPMVTAYVKADRIDVIEDVVYLYRDRPGGTSMTSRASSAASFLSYVTQERQCADLVASVGDDGLRARYASLIHDRDGFFHVRKFLASWTQPQDDDAEAVRLLADLLAIAGPAATWIDIRKRVTLRLFAAGNILAARATAQTVDGGTWSSADGLIRLRSLEALLRHPASDLLVIAQGDRASDGDADAAEERLLRGVAEALENVRIVDAPTEEAWVRLAQAAEERFSERIRALVPEFAAGDVVAAAARQRGFAATVTPLFGRDPIRVHARASSPDAIPVLWSAGSVVRPLRWSWSEKDGGWTCEADFSRSRLPRAVLLQPAFLFADGVVVSGYADSDVPEYHPFDNLLYEQSGAWVRLERRAHWVFRAPRRLVIRTVSAARALTRRVIPARP